jgi:hypothetical protein
MDNPFTYYLTVSIFEFRTPIFIFLGKKTMTEEKHTLTGIKVLDFPWVYTGPREGKKRN